MLQLRDALAAGAFLLDVRDAEEYSQGHVPGAVLMPLTTLPVRYHQLPTDRTIHVICAVGSRSALAAAWLARQGYDTMNVEGGTSEWVAAGLPVQTGR